MYQISSRYICGRTDCDITRQVMLETFKIENCQLLLYTYFTSTTVDLVLQR